MFEPVECSFVNVVDAGPNFRKKGKHMSDQKNTHTTKMTTLFIAQAGIIAALYVALTWIAAGFDLASGAIQVRISEMLCVLPYFTPAAVPGLAIGCLIANFVTGSAMPDVIFGTLATLIGALGSRALRNHRFLCTLSPVIANAVIVPLILIFAYHLTDSFWFLFATVGLGEAIACIGFGGILISALRPVRAQVFGSLGSAKKKDVRTA